MNAAAPAVTQRISTAIVFGLTVGLTLASCSTAPPIRGCRPEIHYLKKLPRKAPLQEPLKWAGLGGARSGFFVAVVPGVVFRAEEFVGLFALLSFDPRSEVSGLPEPDAGEVVLASLEGGA